MCCCVGFILEFPQNFRKNFDENVFFWGGGIFLKFTTELFQKLNIICIVNIQYLSLTSILA